MVVQSFNNSILSAKEHLMCKTENFDSSNQWQTHLPFLVTTEFLSSGYLAFSSVED